MTATILASSSRKIYLLSDFHLTTPQVGQIYDC